MINRIFADKLFTMQKHKNNGRGITCVRTIVDYLRMGNIESARQVARTDHDKLWQYPEIREFIDKNLLGMEDK